MKKITALILAFIMIMAVAPLNASAVREQTEGMYTYYISQTGKCIITKGDPSLSGDLVIPDKLGGVPVKEIGEEAFFDNDKITSITFPESVTEIAKYAFCKCDGLTEVVIPDAVTILGEGAFSECKNLVSVTIGNGITEISKRAFYWNLALKNVTIGNNVTIIGEEAFSNSKALETIVIPDSVIEIGQCSFWRSHLLSSVKIGSGVKIIRNSAFEDCPALDEFVIPDNVEVIEATAFRGYSIDKLILGKGVKDIGDAFVTCDTLNTVVIDEENPYFCADSEGVIFSKDKTTLYSFPQANEAESYSVPEGVKIISEKAFRQLPKLKSVSMPDTVTEIGDYAFESSVNLADIKFSNILKKYDNIILGMALLRTSDRVEKTKYKPMRKTLEVLVSDVHPKKKGHLIGSTFTNKNVCFEGNKDLIGKFVNVEVLSGDTWILKGKII